MHLSFILYFYILLFCFSYCKHDPGALIPTPENQKGLKTDGQVQMNAERQGEGSP